MTTWTWQIRTMYTVQQPNPNYVVNVYFRLIGEQNGVTSFIESNITFDSDQESTFIPYDQLTEQIVIGWVQEALGEREIGNFQHTVQGHIDQLTNPPVIPSSQTLPW